MTGLLTLLILLLLQVETRSLKSSLRPPSRQCTRVKMVDGEIAFGGLLLITSVVGSAFLLKNSMEKNLSELKNNLGEQNAKNEKMINELKVDVKDIRTNFNYLYAGFGISVALLAGFNAVSDAVKNITAIQEQVAKTEKLRIELRQEKKKAEDATELEFLKRQRDFYLLEKK